MRLIDVKTCKLVKFLGYETPPYAILSHTWGVDEEELDFDDVKEGRIDKPGAGSVKFRGCCRQAAKEGLEYVWIDTCCIDKKNSTELIEAINSMFRWYQRASRCYAYLSDVPAGDEPQKRTSKFRTSRWFRRGWTLQELLAPKHLQFYNSEWGYLGTKGKLWKPIGEITSIPAGILLGKAKLHDASVAQRMSWAARRETKKKEDLAYCLLGIFDVTMPLIYGDGGDKAFSLLQEQIIKTTRDDSILAWGLGTKESHTDDPDQATAGGFWQPPYQISRIQGIFLRMYLPTFTTSAGGLLGLLNCGPQRDRQQAVCIPLVKTASGGSDEYFRPRGCHAVLQPIPGSGVSARSIRTRKDRQSEKSSDASRQHWLFDYGAFAELEVNLTLVDVNPQSCWDRVDDIISTPAPSDGTTQRTLARIRHDEGEFPDFVMLLEFEQQVPPAEPRCHVMMLDLTSELVGICKAKGESVAEKEGLDRKLKDRSKRLEQVKRAREMVEVELRKLEERKKELAEEENSETEEMRLLIERKAAVEEQQEQASARWSNALKRWDELCHTDCDKAGYGSKGVAHWMPLRWAAENGHAEMVELLLSEGADVAVADKDGWTPLIAASSKGHLDVVRLLLHKGAEVDLKDKTARAAISYAAEGGHRTIVQLLLKNGPMRMWRLRRTIEGHSSSYVHWVAISPDSTVLASASADCTIRLWDIETGQLQRTLEGHSEPVYSVTFSPDSTVLASASADCTARLWDMETGRQRRCLSDSCYSVAFSPDSTVLASGSADHTIRLWDVETGQVRRTLQGHTDHVCSVAFSPDSTVLASASVDCTIRLWDAETGQLRQTLECNSEILSVAFSPDSTILGSASTDKTIRLWNIATGHLHQILTGHSGWCRSVAFSSDSTLLASASEDGTIRLWEIETVS
ncbi:hypothetical protein B0I37DRAFT_356096 [Chaetomium sp. MPI-CAGE-AT-0009]|nr:hypothetical protein B0I37DRAFT_356096 [Chaetomium sp. MPI-CAGE-AT-0009]